jgi:hypothetical protein
MRILFLILLYIPSFGQDLEWTKQIRDTADKIVISFWGDSNFKNYIHFDSINSRCWGTKPFESENFTSPIAFKANSYRLNYFVLHPAFRGDTAKIMFNLDSNKQFQIFFHPDGLYQPKDLNSLKTITKKKAIEIAKKNGLTNYRNEYDVTLVWVETDPSTLDLNDNSTLQDFIQGHYCWAVESKMKEEYRKGCFVFSTTVYCIDIITGKIIEKKEI